jgi:hypothetical protein
MIIQFDPKTMHVQAICGILENYRPGSEIEDIYKKVEELKAEMAAFRDNTMNPKLNEIIKLVDEHNKKHTPTTK